jgi:hypothetical protein
MSHGPLDAHGFLSTFDTLNIPGCLPTNGSLFFSGFSLNRMARYRFLVFSFDMTR